MVLDGWMGGWMDVWVGGEAVWRIAYSNQKDVLLEKLSLNLDALLQPNSVQCAWNYFETLMINVIDEIVPLQPFVNNQIKKKSNSPLLKNLLNRKKWLLKSKRIDNNSAINERMKIINKEICRTIKLEKSINVWRGIIPGNSKSLWNAVKRQKIKTFA